jgi:hypothetical protein
MTNVEQILKQAERLSPEDRALLISRLQASNLSPFTATPRRAWREIAGTARDLMQVMQVQDWISENRRIADRERSGEVVR